MIPFRYIKTEPTTYLMQYRNGKIVREGAGIAMFYFAPTTLLVIVPVGSVDVPFIFKESTSDYQEVTVQGQVTYRVADAKRLAGLMNFTVNAKGAYVSGDPAELPKRLIHHIQVHTRSELQQLSLRDALSSSDEIVEKLRERARKSDVLASLGLEVLDLAVLAIKPTPETSRALEADAREKLLRDADEAVYSRRNAAIAQERSIKESEFNTEIAIEQKKRQIKEAQVDSERAVKEKRRLIETEELAGRVRLEDQRQALVALASDNARKEADTKAYGMAAMLKSLGNVDSRVLHALTSAGMKPEQMIALAFQELATGAQRIGQLNITPDLLREVMGKKSDD